eukprot:scaffold141141_cov35-Tisochrysis_lutea.AAC.2
MLSRSPSFAPCCLTRPNRLAVLGKLALSIVRSWFPAITILWWCGRALSHSQNSATSFKDPLLLQSPAWRRTSPSGILGNGCTPCVSDTHTKRTVPGG